MRALQVQTSGNSAPQNKKKRSDSQLVHEIVTNACQTSFRVLCARYIDGMYRFIASRITSPHDAEDLVQEIFLAMFKSLPNFRREALFSTWLYRIAQNHIAQFFRQKYHKPTQIDFSETTNLTDSSQSPLNLLSQAEELGRLKLAISELPNIYREAFLLRVAEGFSYRDIAEILDCAPGTVDSRISRARSLLAKKLEDQQ